MARQIKILIVDDHDLVRTAFCRMLESKEGFKVVGEARSGEEAVRIAREVQPDVVLMDVKMPGIGGLEATRKLTRVSSDLKVLVVTVCEDDIIPSRLLQAGAFGYITKSAKEEEMIQAIRSVHSGVRYISPAIAQQLAFRHVEDAEESPFDKLSERELQIMMEIVEGHNPHEISDKLHLSPKTVNSYRYRLFLKLSVKNDVELTLLAIRHGLLDINELIDTTSPQ